MRKLLFAAISMALLASCSGGGSESGGETSVQDTLTTSSGLKIVMLQEGTGEKPAQGDVVTVHYTGYLKATGDTFDSSIERGEPIRFPVGVGKVIPGWDEGIMALSLGSQAMLEIPANLAYGSMERPGIPANSDLVFKVELMGVEPAPKPIAHESWSTEGLEELTTKSGVKYYIVEEGGDKIINPGNNLKVHYHGYLKDGGKVFDSSYKRGEPIDFVYMQDRMIPGWEEVLATITEGTKAIIVIPYQQAYGEQGRPPVIPPKADLVFDIEVVEVAQ